MDFPKGPLDLYLTEIGEPRDNSLRIVVLEAGGRGPLQNLPLSETDEGVEIEGVRLIQSEHASRAFELYWDWYVGYAVVAESFAQLEEGEEYRQDRLYTRTKSAFLTFISAKTFADDNYPGPLVHWSLITLNHCVDVVSVVPPRVRLLTPAELVKQPTNLNFVKG